MKLCLYSIWPFVIRNGDYSCQKCVICEEMFASAGLKPRLETEWGKRNKLADSATSATDMITRKEGTAASGLIPVGAFRLQTKQNN